MPYDAQGNWIEESKKIKRPPINSAGIQQVPTALSMAGIDPLRPQLQAAPVSNSEAYRKWQSGAGISLQDTSGTMNRIANERGANLISLAPQPDNLPAGARFGRGVREGVTNTIERAANVGGAIVAPPIKFASDFASEAFGGGYQPPALAPATAPKPAITQPQPAAPLAAAPIAAAPVTPAPLATAGIQAPPALQSTVPYQPLTRSVGADGTINITGSGQSPEYLARMKAEGRDQAGNVIVKPPSAADDFMRRSRADQDALGKYAGIQAQEASTGLTQAHTTAVGPGIAHTQAQTEVAKQSVARNAQVMQQQNQIIALRETAISDPDSDKRKAAENKIHALLGKPEQKYQVFTQDDTENGLPVKKAYINLGANPDGSPNIVGLTDYLSAKGAVKRSPIKGEKSTVNGKTAIYDGTKWVPQ